MKEALKEAKLAFYAYETPIGCVIVKDGDIIGRGRNMRNTMGNALYHAEIIAIDEACKKNGDWRLEGCTLYVTLEPCPMCAGAILQARIPRVVFGAQNIKHGCAGSIVNLLEEPRFNHQVEVVGGVMQAECSVLMTDFFKKFRKAST